MFHPSRGGVRGGRDQFNWDDVKSDKDRFNYLGNSLKAVVKKPWNQGPEAGWYVKDESTGIKRDEKIMTEVEMIKAQEREYMKQVLSKGFGFKKDSSTTVVPSAPVPAERNVRGGSQVRERRDRRREDDYSLRDVRSRESRPRESRERRRSRSRSPERRRSRSRSSERRDRHRNQDDDYRRYGDDRTRSRHSRNV